jgi:Spy/CpxP family protein refolding chaperone
MKKVLAIVAAIAAFSCATSGYAMKNPGDNPAWGEGGMKGGMALTADQQAKMKDLAEAQKKEMGPLMEAYKIKVDELRLLVDKKAPDDQLVAKLAEVSAARDAVQQAMKKWMDKRAEILTPRQRALMVIKMEGKPGMGMGMGKRMGGRKGMDAPEGAAPGGNSAPEGKPAGK